MVEVDSNVIHPNSGDKKNASTCDDVDIDSRARVLRGGEGRASSSGRKWSIFQRWLHPLSVVVGRIRPLFLVLSFSVSCCFLPLRFRLALHSYLNVARPFPSCFSLFCLDPKHPSPLSPARSSSRSFFPFISSLL